MNNYGMNHIFNLVLIMICGLVAVQAQNENRPKSADEPVLVPLTEAEKRLDPRNIVENQPDFTAVESYFSAREISGFSAVSKVARKGNKYRIDTGMVVVITERGKPTLRLLSDKTFEESVGIRKPFVSATTPLNPTELLEFPDIAFTALGTIEVGGNKLLKIQAKSKEFPQEVFLYADLGKKNLLTIIQILSPQRSSIQRLNDVSFEVPASLFDLTGYRALPKYKWNKLKTAKVIFDGNEVKNALVFRHENYLFIHVGEFDHFFVDLDKKTADTVVFRGLLVAKDGNYIWRTGEEEATSVGDLDGIIKDKCDSCVKIKLDANSVEIPNPKNTAKTLLKINW